MNSEIKDEISKNEMSMEIEKKKDKKRKKNKKQLLQSTSSQTSIKHNLPSNDIITKTLSTQINQFCPFEKSNDIIFVKNERYSIDNFSLYQNKFKSRYLKERIKEYNECYISSSSLVSKEKNSITNNILRPSLNNNNKIIKHTSTYLNTMQKSVILFNSKKYDDCYHYLISHNIIKDQREFAELLLVYNGYDKNSIGNFLSKNTYELNQDYIILKYFIEKINFTNVPILNSLRFLLSRVNLPSDSNLLLKIIEIFAEVFYSDNKHLDIYPDSNAIYLLCSVILAVNTMLVRKDITNIKVISKEEFASMNNSIRKDICDNIYNALACNNLNVIYDYNETFNRKLSVVSKIDKNKKQLEKNSTIVLDDISIEENEGESLIAMMKKGNQFIKYGSNNPSMHNKYIYLDVSEGKLIIKKTCFFLCNKTRAIYISDILDVYYGTNNSKFNDKYNIKPQHEQCCLSIETKKRIIDIKSAEVNQCMMWYKGIKYLIKKYNKKDTSINLQLLVTTEDKLVNIWKNTILPNWDTYREVLINHSNTNNDKINFCGLYKRNGIPKIFRRKMWDILIGNEMQISQMPFISEVCDNDLINKHINSLFCTISEINFDIIIQENIFKQNIKEILFSFLSMRKDIPYNKNIIYIIAVFVLNNGNDNNTKTFSEFCNFVHHKAKFLIHILLRDEGYLNNRISFFDEQIEKKLPKLHKHFANLEIETKLYFTIWNEYIFSKYFISKRNRMLSSNNNNIEILFKLFDLIISNGELIIFEISLSLLIILEKKLLNMTIENIMKILTVYPYEFISNDDLMLKISEIDISKEYNIMITKEQLSHETKMLLTN